MRRPITIPTAIGVLLLLGGVALGIFGIRQGKELVLKAAIHEQPRNVRVTNVSDNSVSISWITDSPVGGYVSYREAGGDERAAKDIRDTGSSQLGKYTTHYVDITGLREQTYYEFRLASGRWTYDNHGEPYKVLTPSHLETVNANDLVEGVVSKDEKAAVGAIVYFDLNRLTPLSTLVKSTGAFTIPLSQARTRDLRGLYTDPVDGEVFSLLIEGGDMGQARAKVNMENRGLVPEIAIPGDYDFSTSVPIDLSGDIALPTRAPIVSGSGLSPTKAPESKFSFVNLAPPVDADEISIKFPGPLETINDTTPEFTGEAPPGKSLTLTISPSQQTRIITANSEGNWNWTPGNDLETGEQTVTISYVDTFGSLQKLVRRFYVL